MATPVLVDTGAWSTVMRKRPHGMTAVELATRTELERLIHTKRALMMGPIRQELLAGISDWVAFERLRSRLRGFVDLELDSLDYESAAHFFNLCKPRGVLGSHTDFLICAVAQRRGVPILTTDRDFDRYAAVLDFKLVVIS
jgi:predicted nucleic acid-binding protein